MRKLLTLATLSLMPTLAHSEGKVAGALVVAGQSVTLAHARAITESQGSDDDPVTIVLLTEKPLPKNYMDGLNGQSGAYVKVVVGKSGRIQQATLLHAAIDATSSALIPPSLVKASNLHVTGHELSGQFAGEKKAPGKPWSFHLDFTAAIQQ